MRLRLLSVAPVFFLASHALALGGDMNQPGVGVGVAVSAASLTTTGCIKTDADGAEFNANCTAGKVGIGAAVPSALLHISSGTLLVDGTGASVSAPGQPGFRASMSGNEDVVHNGWQRLYFGTEQYDHGGVFDHTGSSGAFTVPASQAGVWLVGCAPKWTQNTTGLRATRIQVDGADYFYSFVNANTATDGPVSNANGPIYLTAGQVVTCDGFQTSGGTLTAEAAVYSMFYAQKLW